MTRAGNGGSFQVNWQIVAIVFGLIGQAWWLATDLSATKTSVAQLGVALQNKAEHGETSDLARRISTIEQLGSPVLQGLRTQIDVNTRRLDTLEQYVPGTITKLTTQDAQQLERIIALQHEMDRLRDWRVARSAAAPQEAATIAQLKAQIAELHGRLDRLAAAQAGK